MCGHVQDKLASKSNLISPARASSNHLTLTWKSPRELSSSDRRHIQRPCCLHASMSTTCPHTHTHSHHTPTLTHSHVQVRRVSRRDGYVVEEDASGPQASAVASHLQGVNPHARPCALGFCCSGDEVIMIASDLYSCHSLLQISWHHFGLSPATTTHFLVT